MNWKIKWFKAWGHIEICNIFMLSFKSGNLKEEKPNRISFILSWRLLRLRATCGFFIPAFWLWKKWWGFKWVFSFCSCVLSYFNFFFRFVACHETEQNGGKRFNLFECFIGLKHILLLLHNIVQSLFRDRYQFTALDFLLN